MRYLILILLFSTTQSFAQNYKAEMKQYFAAYKQDFIDNPNSPLTKKDLHKLNFFKIDSNYRVSATIELLPEAVAIKFPTSAGTIKKYIRYAKARFKLNGQALSLTLFRSEVPSQNPKYTNALFLPFTDQTNSKSTYGGGRYIDVFIPDIKDGRLVIDFNKAYNPYCAYRTGYQCPIPPEENDLPIAIHAGEKKFSSNQKLH